MGQEELRRYAVEIRALETSPDGRVYHERLRELMVGLEPFLVKRVKDGDVILSEVRSLLEDRETERAAAVLERAKTSWLPALGRLGPRLAGPLCLFAIGAVVCFLGVRQLLTADESSNWPIVEGEIVSSTVAREQAGGTGTGHGPFPNTSHSRTWYVAAVEYRYTVDGKRYQADRISYQGQRGTKADALRLVAQYPMGSKVTVHYDPQDPSEATLVPGWSASILAILFLIGLGCTTGAVLMFIRGTDEPTGN